MLLCACSHEEGGAKEAARDAASVPSAPHPQIPPSLLPAGSTPSSVGRSDPVKRDNPWERCRTGYVPVGDPARDVLQLGLMCGPSTGMRSLDGRVEGRAPGELAKRFDAKAGECFRVVFAAEPDVHAELTWSSTSPHIGAGAAAVVESARGRALIAPGASALCLSAPGEVALRLEARGSGRYAYQIFKRR